MIDTKPIIKMDTRILRPWEWDAMRDRLKPGTQIVCDAMLATQMRHTEFWVFIKHPEWFRPAGRCVDLPRSAIHKTETLFQERTVLLSIDGVESVKTLFSCSARIRTEKDRSNLRKELRAAAHDADIGEDHISPKMFRKTMVSWLMATFPEKEPFILMSVGHGREVQQRHYLASGFDRGDLESMRKKLAGWGGA